MRILSGAPGFAAAHFRYLVANADRPDPGAERNLEEAGLHKRIISDAPFNQLTLFAAKDQHASQLAFVADGAGREQQALFPHGIEVREVRLLQLLHAGAGRQLSSPLHQERDHVSRESRLR